MAAPTPASTPQELRVDPHLLTVLRQLLAAAAPNEGCALLLGERCGATWRLRTIWPCLNVWPDRQQRQRRFAIDPREQLVAQQWARQRQLALLGSAHSHPTSEPLPSPTDRALTVAPALMVIAGPAGELRAWWLSDNPSAELPIAQELPLR